MTSRPGLMQRIVLGCCWVGCGGTKQAGVLEPDSSPPDAAAAADASASDEPRVPDSFSWVSTDPLIAPIPNDRHAVLSIKDPTVVHFEDRWHVFATVAYETNRWNMVYLNFTDWEEAGSASHFFMSDNPALNAYHAAPMVFFFTPHNKWYLIFQSGQPQYTTTDDITDPESWPTPINFFAEEPPIIAENAAGCEWCTWLDFWAICDDASCYLFFTDDNGHFYRSRTSIDDFPNGFDEPVVVISGTPQEVFEGNATYRIQETNQYLTLIEAFGPNGERYYRSFIADSLDGEWTPLADTWENPFAAVRNVTFESGNAWTEEVSHGELLRAGYDETVSISLEDLRFLYQGLDPTQTIGSAGLEYFQLPYRLGVLSLVDP